MLTGEYLVLEGATALAVPTKFGQDLKVEKIKEPQLIWGSFTNTGDCWFEAVFELPKLRLVNATFNSDSDGKCRLYCRNTSRYFSRNQKIESRVFYNLNKGFW